uniref:Addiction module component n=1 Tax=Candidatus Kentrum sp. SD TaxID=2126332 RepID=A0A450YXX0_9GAMM|nr:MAG: hypothetical protein BECKSD772F_GA0070984_107012 [Candidatus Kentron sp. SD]VFK46392.1 MAG: hypothetical protein BECKSD772E_GA0070983_107212 [Candidatus Kentron sp. SD]VFK79504.1 MAG: hypothetical protein BECKSD772D_GA0070982_105215 [Candidatus Kentron sp. SD]
MLSATFKSELNRLPLRDKLEVFDVIRGSVMPSAEDGFPELSAGQMQALLQRAERAASNPGAGRSWPEVKKGLEG